MFLAPSRRRSGGARSRTRHSPYHQIVAVCYHLGQMPPMNDTDRNVFSDAYKSVVSNFTVEEQAEIHELAVKLRLVLDAAVKRSSA